MEEAIKKMIGESDDIQLTRAKMLVESKRTELREMVCKIGEMADGEEIAPRLMAATLSMELLDIATDMFAIAVVTTALEMSQIEKDGIPHTNGIKFAALLIDKLHSCQAFGSAAQAMMLIGIRNVIDSGIIGEPEPRNVTKSIVATLDKFLKSHDMVCDAD